MSQIHLSLFAAAAVPLRRPRNPNQPASMAFAQRVLLAHVSRRPPSAQRFCKREPSAFIELVEFGMEDVGRTIQSRMAQIKESVRTGLSTLTGTLQDR